MFCGGGWINHWQVCFCAFVDTYLGGKPFVSCVALVKPYDEIGLITNRLQELVCLQVALQIDFSP